MWYNEWCRYKFINPIQGLRAWAVIAVVTFHFFPSLLPLGYLGVDVWAIPSIDSAENSLSDFSSYPGFSYRWFWKIKQWPFRHTLIFTSKELDGFFHFYCWFEHIPIEQTRQFNLTDCTFLLHLFILVLWKYTLSVQVIRRFLTLKIARFQWKVSFTCCIIYYKP